MMFSDFSKNQRPQWSLSQISEPWSSNTYKSYGKAGKAIAVALLSSSVLIGQVTPLLASPSPVLISQRSQFIRGLNPGDRVVVRLFDTAGDFLGYSGFELLDENAAVNLVLSDNPWRDRLVRTVYGVDRDRNGQIDTNAQTYDYFTHVTKKNGSEAPPF